MNFSYNFYKSDNFILKYFSRFFINKLSKINKTIHTSQLVLIKNDHVSNEILIDGYYEGKELKVLCEWLKKKKKLKLRVGFNHRYHPAFLLAKKIINQKKIGKIFCIRAVYGHGGRLGYEKEWRFNKKYSGGGELIDKGSHLIDLSRLFLGNLKVDTFSLNNFFWRTNLEDNCFLNLKYLFFDYNFLLIYQ